VEVTVTPSLRLCICVLLSMTVVQSASIDMGYQAIVDKVFRDISETKGSEWLASLYRTNPYNDTFQEGINRLKSSYESIEPILGKYRGRTLILKREVGDRVVYLYYLVAFDREPVRFEFLFYRPGDKWFIHDFSFNDKITDDIRELAKYGLRGGQK
jgi:hypothetical protein